MFTDDIVADIESIREYYYNESGEAKLYSNLYIFNLQLLGENEYSLDYKDKRGNVYRYIFILNEDSKISSYRFENVIT